MNIYVLMKLRSLQFNDISWKCRLLSEYAISLQPQNLSDIKKLDAIHQLVNAFRFSKPKGVCDIIHGYESLVFIFDRLISNPEDQLTFLETSYREKQINKKQPTIHIVPVCYELGLDWDEVEAQCAIKQEGIMQRHLDSEYTVAAMGFLPGFIYLSGLDTSIKCRRRINPRTSIPAGSVGIGGEQTGIYSIESPGGWQIIGRTPKSFFDVNKIPPTDINLGDTVRFERISPETFRELQNAKT